MKKMLLFVAMLVLVGCTNTFDTADEAIHALEIDDNVFDVTGILDQHAVSDTQVFYVLEGNTTEGADFLVVNVLKEQDAWHVEEFINVGQLTETSYSSGANTFETGMSREDAEKRDGRIIIPTNQQHYFIWIDAFDTSS